MQSSQFILYVLLGVFTGQTEKSKTDDAPKSSAEQRLAFARQAAADYRFRISGREKTEVRLHPEPLLRWNNQVVREDDGILFIWTEGRNGRPVATAQFFLVETIWHHEFQSLSPDDFEANFIGNGGDGWVWQPNRSGLEFVRPGDVNAPGDTPAQRLRQMKAIAERFTAAVDPEGTFASPEQLRLLKTPVYRYSAESQGILDGAMFAITQGTNPEVLVLVEAEGANGAEKSWRYSFARMSCFYLRVYRGDQIVWKRDRAPVTGQDRGSDYHFRLNALPDGSADVRVPK